MSTRHENGTRVQTKEPETVSTDWTEDALLTRKWGVQGEIIHHHDSHGLTYEVRHSDGSIGHYEPRELVALV